MVHGMTYDLKELERLRTNAVVSDDAYDLWRRATYAHFPAILRDLKRLAALEKAMEDINAQHQLSRFRAAMVYVRNRAAGIEKGE